MLSSNIGFILQISCTGVLDHCYLSNLMLFSRISASTDGNQTCISANRRSEMSVKRSRKPIMVILRKGQISTAKINSLCVATGEVKWIVWDH
jgi:hypothetical protein